MWGRSNFKLLSQSGSAFKSSLWKHQLKYPTFSASISIRKADGKADGVRYYQASPYLLVDSDGKAVEESPAPRRIEPGDRWHSQQNDRQIKNSCPRLTSGVFG